MLRAIREYEIGELKTLLPFHEAILQTEQWANAETCRDLIEDRAWLKHARGPEAREAARSSISPNEQQYTVEVSGKRFDVTLIGAPPTASGASPPPLPRSGRRALRGGSVQRSGEPRVSGPGRSGDALNSPLQGTVFKVAVRTRPAVEEGALICVIEAMKMENEITAHKPGVVTELNVTVGAAVQAGDVVAVIQTNEFGVNRTVKDA